MRSVAFCGLICLLSVAALASDKSTAQQVTVSQLTARIASLHNSKDKRLAGKLQNLQLSERMDPASLAALLSSLPGDESRSALSALADRSAFLAPPPEQVVADPPPSAAEQQSMIAAMVEAAAHPPMPQVLFDSTRSITRYRNLKYMTGSHMDPIAIATPLPLYLSRTTNTLSYREGATTVTDPTTHLRFAEHVNDGVEDWDGFRTLLSDLKNDLLQTPPEWLRWEREGFGKPDGTGKLAVLRFNVAQEHSSLALLRVLPVSVTWKWAVHPAYVCDVTLEPATGRVRRFVLRSQPKEKWLNRADVALEFAPVPVADGALMPTRAILWAKAQTWVKNAGVGYDTPTNWSHGTPEHMQLDHIAEVVFSDYRPVDIAEEPLVIPSRDAVWAMLGANRTRLTFNELEHRLASATDRRDAQLAQDLRQVELSHRITEQQFQQLRAHVLGKASAAELATVRDMAEFEDAPPNQLLAGKAPDAAAQGTLLKAAVEFVTTVGHKLPDLFATRQLMRYEDLYGVRGILKPEVYANNPFTVVDQSTGTMKVREGREVVEQVKQGPGEASVGLDTWGAFGPMLQTVMADVLQGKIGWSHWETGPTGTVAVFRYVVPESGANYDVRFCCYISRDGVRALYSAMPAYHGEISIDQSTGAILRLTIRADLKAHLTPFDGGAPSPLKRSDVVVEYGPVEMGGRIYICPTRMVSIFTTWTLGLSGPLKTYVTPGVAKKIAEEAMKELQHSRVTAINEAAFTDYHVFRSEMRIVSDGTPEPKQKAKKVKPIKQ